MASRLAQLKRVLQSIVFTPIGFLIFATIADAATPSSERGLLGHYYEGLHIGSYPTHITRVDRVIDFHNISELGALPSPSVVVWKGWIEAPVQGVYSFVILADDSGWLTIDGNTVIADPGESVSKFREEGSVPLIAGRHAIELGQRNIWGDSSMQLRWQPPGHADELVPENVLSLAPIADTSK
jgi:hypothetical protein